MKHWIVVALGLVLVAGAAVGQGTKADYERAMSLPRRTENKLARARVEPQWLPGNTSFWYRVDSPDSREFVFVDVLRGERRPAFDHRSLASALARAAQREVSATQLPVDALAFPSNSTVQFNAFGKRWEFAPAAGTVAPASGAVTNATIPKEATPRASRRTGPETTITFVNRTSDDAEIFWISTDNERRSYGRVRPNDEKEMHTYAGHVWLAADRTGRPIAVFEAREQGGQAVIDNERGQDRPRGRNGGRNGDGPRAGGRPNSGPQSPDGRWRASIQNHNLLVEEVATKARVLETTNGTATRPYEEPFRWSPDGTKLMMLQGDKVDVRKIQFVESSPKDQLQPRVHTMDYVKPGDPLPHRKVRLFDVAGRREVPVADELFANPYELGEFRWAKDSSRFTFAYNQRGHQVWRILDVNATNGAVRPIVNEETKTFFDYAGKKFTHYSESTNEIIWASERDGWNHLYLIDADTGAVKTQITRGEWPVRSVERVDEAARQVWFRAGGVRPGQDPYYLHLCRVNFDGTGLVVLTEGDGTHKWEFSPDRRWFLDTWSRVDQPPVNELRSAVDGRLVCLLERADDQALVAAGMPRPERFVAKGRDGTTDIFGIIIRPSNFDSAKKYPVIEEIYAGPHAAFVPKEYGRLNRQRSIAELGFIVVQIDGMGTSYRSKAFHDVCWKNLGDAGFPDRIAWMKAAAARYPSMDLTRVGIYGGSAGGQSSTRALLAFGDFYKVAVSDCGCHDNRMDKIWWNELWMSWPVGPHYAEQSNVTQAHRLTGKLMLVVGEMDRNVDPASTMQVANALIKADKDFDLLVVPGGGHGIAESPYGSRRRMDFFVRHLLGAEPRRN